MFLNRKARELRENRAALTIQRYMKGWFHRTKYISAKRSIMALQQYGRGYLARKKFSGLMDNYRAIEIQRYCRGYLARKRYNFKIRSIIQTQAYVRRYLAKTQFKKLKAEARSISHLQTKYKGLENKIIELQQKVDITNKENLSLKSQQAVIPELK